MAGWTDAEDRKLLLSIIQLLSPSPPNWEDVANKVGKTKEAVRFVSKFTFYSSFTGC